MEISLSTKGYKVIESGVVLLDEADSELKFDIKATDNFEFKIILKFYDTDNGKLDLEKEVETEKNIIILKCKNFSSGLGTGTAKPLHIATVSEKEIFLNFWAYTLGDEKSARKVEYTFLEEE